MIDTYRGSVFASDCDEVGIMHVKNYVGKFEEATCQLIGSVGFTPQYLRDNNISVVSVEHHIKYINELLPKDLIVIKSQILELSRSSIKFFHRMTNVQTNMVAAEMVIVAVQINGSNRKSSKIPDAIANKIVNHIAEHDQ
jgi:acyl-CoA thioester hydrolase